MLNPNHISIEPFSLSFRFADGIILFHNDELFGRLSGRSTTGSDVPQKQQSISLTDLNAYIEDCLSNIFYPMSVPGYRGRRTTQNEISSVSGNKSATSFDSGQTHKPAQRPHTENDYSSASGQGAVAKLSTRSSKENTVRAKAATSKNFVHLKPEFNTLVNSETSHLISKLSIKSDVSNFSFEGQHLSQFASSLPWEITGLLLPSPNFKFISMYNTGTRQLHTDYEKILQPLLRGIPKFDAEGNRYKFVAGALVARGECGKMMQYESEKVVKRTQDYFQFVDWNHHPFDLWTSKLKLCLSLEWFYSTFAFTFKMHRVKFCNLMTYSIISPKLSGFS